MEFVHEENKPLQCRICDPLFALKFAQDYYFDCDSIPTMMSLLLGVFLCRFFMFVKRV